MSPATPEPPSSNPPEWPHCGHGAAPETDPVGCRGIHVPGHTACLGHLDETDRAAYLAALSPGADFDHRGTPFTEDLLGRLLDALRDPTTGRPRLGHAQFDEATFTGTARFDGATFIGDAEFGGATFKGDTWFMGTTFTSDALFQRVLFTRAAGFLATFKGDAWFMGTTFTGNAGFARVTFNGNAVYIGAAFEAEALFLGATFIGHAGFLGATFARAAQFPEARFEAEAQLGPLVCGGTLVLSGAVFAEPTTVRAAAGGVTCEGTRWASAAKLDLRYAELDLSDAVLEYPLMVTARPTPFSLLSVSQLSETPLCERDPGVHLRSVAGVDAAHLMLHDIDLSSCRFAGAIHLDQLRVDGWCTFATTPTGPLWHRLFSVWWSRRSTVAEEHHWRAQARHPAAARGWTPAPEDTPVLRPAALAALYRQMRKSLEDGKNEPDAADFYYGEMEMRRHDDTRPRVERALLTAYWAISGYGLRATRALGWLLGAMSVTLLALLLWGLPVDDPKPTTTGRQVAIGQEVTLTTDTPDPVNPTGPLADRLTTERFEKALRVVINSVVFRSSGQDLTTTGTYTEMTSRFTEPVLLGLAVLAVRSRVKR